jgi:hypothetical protein
MNASAERTVNTVDLTSKERRRSERFVVVAPVIFSWRTRNGILKTARGITRNICVKGMFVASEDCPPVSSVVRCEVQLPAFEGSEEPVVPLVLQAVGRVVRVRLHNTIGFGMSSRASLLA